MQIIFKDNNDLRTAETIRKLNLPIVVYGYGSIARHTVKKMNEIGLQPSAFVLDDLYAKDNKDAISISDCNKNYSEFVLLLGFFEAFFMSAELLRNKFPGASKVLFFSETYGYEMIDNAFFTAHKDDFYAFYKLLEDDTSKQSFQAFLNAKINSNASYLWPYVVIPQYTPTTRVMTGLSEIDFLNLNKTEILVNCGAYNGDTVRSFLNVVGNKCEKVYAIEPDQENIRQLKKFIDENRLHNIVSICEVGVSDEKRVLRFSSKGGMTSSIREDGDTTIRVDKIDNIIGETPVTFINMDIEGSELEALKGAASVIKKHKPTLAISAYHKRMDCINIPKYLKELVPPYKFYFRLHKPIAIDAVLYAVAK